MNIDGNGFTRTSNQGPINHSTITCDDNTTLINLVFVVHPHHYIWPHMWVGLGLGLGLGYGSGLSSSSSLVSVKLGLLLNSGLTPIWAFYLVLWIKFGPLCKRCGPIFFLVFKVLISKLSIEFDNNI